MIKHIVLMKWHEGTSNEQIDAIEDAFSSMVEAFEFIVSYEFGPDAGIYPNDFDYALVAEFENEADFKVYVEDPQHQDIMKDVIAPVMADYTAMQFIC